MKRPTEAQAAKIEARIESMIAHSQYESADRLRREYWDACGLSLDVRKQLDAANPIVRQWP